MNAEEKRVVAALDWLQANAHIRSTEMTPRAKLSASPGSGMCVREDGTADFDAQTFCGPDIIWHLKRSAGGKR